MAGAERGGLADKPVEEFSPGRAEFLGVTFDTLTLEDLMQRVTDRRADAPFAYVITPNTDHVVRFNRMPEAVEAIYRDAAFTVCDSRILAALAKFSGIVLTTVPGSDFTARFIGEAINTDDSVLVVGGDAEQIERLKAIYGLRNVEHFDAPMNLAQDPVARRETAQFVLSHPARYIFFALGSPQQELVAHEVWRSGQAIGTGLCIGASIDFLTGKAKRAPRVMQSLKLEWLYRLIQEPGRLWRRYLVEDVQVFAIYRRWRRHRSKQAQGSK